MDLEHFYCLSNNTETNKGDAVSKFQIEDPEGLLYGLNYPKKPLIFELPPGAVPEDFIGTNYGILFLISDKVFSLLKRHSFSGWSTFSVELFSHKGEKVEGYHGFVVLGKSGPIDFSYSDEEPRLLSSGKEIIMRIGYIFDNDTWDGSDFFSPEDSFAVFTVEKVKQVLEKEKLSNIYLERVTDIEYY